MSLTDFIAYRMEKENRKISKSRLRFNTPSSPDEIVELYRTYHGIKRHMRALSADKVMEYIEKGYAFVGAYYDRELAGIAVSKQLPTDFPYFTLPRDEKNGLIYTLGGLYVRPDFQGMGIASRMANIITEGTEEFGKQTNEVVGMGYEVSFDNFGSLRIISKHGNYIGFYKDSDNKEGLTILLYRPYTHEPTIIDKPNITLTKEENTSLANLSNGLNYIANQEQIGGLTSHITQLDDGETLETTVLNNTPSTIPEPTFDMEM